MCSFLFACVPLKQVSAAETTTKRAPNVLEQQMYINPVLNAEIVEYTEGLFVTTSYDDIKPSIEFAARWELYIAGVVNVAEIELDEETINKANAQHEKYLKLEEPFMEYIVSIFNEAAEFYNAISVLEDDYATVTKNDVDKYKEIKSFYIKFWGEGKNENDEEAAANKIYASYFRVAYDGNDENASKTADTEYVNKATAIVDNCLNKAVALNIAEEKMADFKTRIEALPPILEITNENEEALNKLKNDLQEFNDKYAVHLDDDTKQTIENYQWVVDQSLARIKNESDFTMLIVVVAIIAVGFGAYLMIRYVLLPWLKTKRGKRKK